VIVVDVNVVVHLLTASARHALAKALWEQSSSWCLPTLWRHEFLNVLVTLCREGYLSREDAVELWDRAISLFASSEIEVDWPAALRTALDHRISGYDAQYAMLAERLDTVLVTEDLRLRKAFPKRCLSLEQALKAR
jgi:predicted nucleic acid-binding protein